MINVYEIVLLDVSIIDILLLFIAASCAIIFLDNNVIKTLKNKISVKFKKRHQKNSLLKYVIEKTNKTKPDIKKIIDVDIKPRGFPHNEVLLVFIVFIVFFIGAHLHMFIPMSNLFQLHILYDYQDLIYVHMGIGAVIVGLAFFIAQEIARERNDKRSYKGFIILRRSKFLPLMLAEILFSFIFIGESVNVLVVFPLVAITAFTVYSLYKTFEILIDSFELEREEQKQFFEKTNSSFLKVLDFEHKKIIGNNRLRNFLENNRDSIEKNVFFPFEKEGYTPIKKNKVGIFEDLNLGNFEKLIDKLKEIANANNSILKEGSISVDTSPTNPQTFGPHCSLTECFYSYTEEFNQTLIFIRNDLLEGKNFNKIEKLVSRVFKIKKSNFDLEVARDNINKLKLLSLDSVKYQKGDELDKVLNSYLKLTDNLYLYLKPYGEGFSREQAENLSMDMFFGWRYKPIAWINEDVREIFDFAIKSERIEAIIGVVKLHARLMLSAIKSNDYLIFKQIKHYPLNLYRVSLKVRKSRRNNLAPSLFDISWRYLEEISSIIMSEFKRGEGRTFDFVNEILKIFQSLLKASFDGRDVKSFNKYLSVVGGLFQNNSMRNHHENEKVQQCEDYIENKKNDMLFGLASWIFYKLSEDRKDKEIIEFYNTVQSLLPSRLEDLTETFSRVYGSEEDRNSWMLSDWEGSENEIGEAYWTQIPNKLTKFYMVKALSLLTNMEDEEIENIDLTRSRKLTNLISNSGGLINVCDEIKVGSEGWWSILEDDAVKKVEAFKRLLIKVRGVQEQEDLELKRSMPISQNKIREFKEEVLSNFYKDAHVRKIFKEHLNTYEDKLSIGIDEERRFGFKDVIGEKEVFFEDWHVHFASLGENYGRNLASADNFRILDPIINRCDEIKKHRQISKEGFDKLIEEIENKEELVIFSINNQLEFFFKDFILEGLETDLQNYDIKKYKFKEISIPAFEICSDGIDKQILILNKSKIGKIIQLSPLNSVDNVELVENIFYMDVQAFSEKEELRNEFMDNPPEWLKEIGDRQKQEKHLCEYVLIKIFERFRYEKPKDFEGYKIKFYYDSEPKDF